MMPGPRETTGLQFAEFVEVDLAGAKRRLQEGHVSSQCSLVGFGDSSRHQRLL
jgi:hypothetical protein